MTPILRPYRALALSLMLVVALVAGALPIFSFTPSAGAATPGDIKITEWMYQGSGSGDAGEFVELTNVGGTTVDVSGWRYDDDSASYASGFDLSGLGEILPGESVVFTEIGAAAFRTEWNLCEDAKVLGGYTNNLGRADQINIFNAGGTLVDRLTYGDQAFPGSPRTTQRSAWVTAAGLGANNPTQWTLSSVADSEGSIASTLGSTGNPGYSSRATVSYDPCAPAVPGAIRITEYMYQGSGSGDAGEFVELTNIGGLPVDVTGWKYDDDSASYAEGFDLSGFGEIAAGESVTFTEISASAFRTEWDLCPTAKVLGGYINNLGRGDQINIFDATGAIVDRLSFGDQVFPGSPRTTKRSAWVSAAGVGTNNALAWTLSTAGDAENSVTSSFGSVGSPNQSTLATVPFEACEPVTGTITATIAPSTVTGAVGDPTNPPAMLTLDSGDPGVPAADLTVTATSSNEAVIPAANVTVTGAGAERSVAFAPTGRGIATVTLNIAGPGGNTGSVNVEYAASAAAPDASGRYHQQISDASAALDVGDGYMLLLNDETNTIFLHRQDVSGPPVKTWNFTPSQLGTGDEIDFEGITRSGDQLLITGSHGNNRSGEVRTERRTFIGATITGSGATTEVVFAGRYNNLWSELRNWDSSDGHGLGANALGFVAGSTPGVLPNAPDGFNVEGLEYAPNGETVYLGFRAPTVNVGGEQHAVIVPVLNPDELVAGAPGTGPAQFGDPILLDLDGRSIRAIASNSFGEYLISAGASPQNDTWALYSWDGNPAHQPKFDQALPTPDEVTGGTWESIVSVPHPFVPGAPVRLVTDSGDTSFYGTGATKDLPQLLQKSYSQVFSLQTQPRLYCNGLEATIVGSGAIEGTAGDDVIVGSDGVDTINGLGGNDTICALAGNDVVNGNSGLDWIDGGRGNDTLNGGNDNDMLYGKSGVDTINGDAGDDTLLGGSEDDTIIGGSGNDTIRGEDGRDTLAGWSGNDFISGGNDNDVINGDAGNDVLQGNAGADKVYGGADNDSVDGGSGDPDACDGGLGTDIAPGGCESQVAIP